jgi:hypothetical protein
MPNDIGEGAKGSGDLSRRSRSGDASSGSSILESRAAPSVALGSDDKACSFAPFVILFGSSSDIVRFGCFGRRKPDIKGKVSPTSSRARKMVQLIGFGAIRITFF